MRLRGSGCYIWLLCMATVVSVWSQQPELQPTGEPLTLKGTQTLPLTWQLPTTAGFPAFNVSDGSQMTLQYVKVVDESKFNEQLLSNQSFASLLLLPWLVTVAPAGKVVMQHVIVQTNCQTLRAIQNTACASLSMQQLGRLQVLYGSIRIPEWTSNLLSVQDLEFVCDEPALSPAILAQPTNPITPALLQCAVGHALDWSQMFSLTKELQQYAWTTHIMLDTNVTVPPSYTTADKGHVDVYRRVRMAPLPALEGRLVYMSLDYIQGEGLWRVTQSNASLTFEDITFTTLPLGPSSKYPMSVLPWGMWMVELDRCNPLPGQLVVTRCLLVTQTEIMDYVSYWAAEYLSVFPDRAEAAKWYGEDPTCHPAQNRTLLKQQTKLRDQYTWVVENAFVIGCQLNNLTITSKFPAGLTPAQPGLQLTKLFDAPYIPFPSITWVSTATQLVAALQEQMTPYIIVMQNISVDPLAWPVSPIKLRRNIAISGWTSRVTVLDWRGVSHVVKLGDHTMDFRNIYLMNGGQGGPKASPVWAANLTLYQWAIRYNWTSIPALRLQSVTLVVPTTEFAILTHQAQSRQQGPASANWPSGLSWLQMASFHRDWCGVPMLVEDGLLGYNVTITTQPCAFEQLPLEVILHLDNQQAPPPSPRNDSWKEVLAVVLPSVLGLLSLLAGCGYVLWRQRCRGRPTMCPSDGKSCDPKDMHLIDNMPSSFGGASASRGAGGAQSGPNSTRNGHLSTDKQSMVRPLSSAQISQSLPELLEDGQDGKDAAEITAGEGTWDDQCSTHSGSHSGSYVAGTPAKHLQVHSMSPSQSPQGQASRSRSHHGGRTMSGPPRGDRPVSTGCMGRSPRWPTSPPPSQPAWLDMPQQQFDSQTSLPPRWLHSPAASKHPGSVDYQQHASCWNPSAGGLAQQWLEPPPQHQQRWAQSPGGSHHTWQEPHPNSGGKWVPSPGSSNHPIMLEHLPREPQWTSSLAGSHATDVEFTLLPPMASPVLPQQQQQARWQSHGRSQSMGKSNSHSHAVSNSHSQQDEPNGTASNNHSEPPSKWPATAGTLPLECQSFVDSFDCMPLDKNQLLIRQIDLTPEVQAVCNTPDVAAQLKSLVTRMQSELGDPEAHITRVVGHGSSGVVYQGLWRGLTVAIKSLVFTVLPAQPMTRRQQRAMTEAAICRTLQHPNIVATYSYDLQTLQASGVPGNMTSPTCSHSHSTGTGSECQCLPNGTHKNRLELPIMDSLNTAVEYKLHIIQEFCDGGTLKNVIDDGHLHTTDERKEPLMGPIIQLAIDMAVGMAHVHSRNIVHGDLTPTNVLMKINRMTDSQFSAKVADFGLSWKLASGQEHVSNARQGTGFYISPEVLHVGIMSKAADVFSFGMLLHEMYHGPPVWRRRNLSMADAAAAANKRPGLEQLQWSDRCPPELRHLITTCLAADPQARPSFNEVISQLKTLKQHLTSASPRTLVLPPLITTSASAEGKDEAPPPIHASQGNTPVEGPAMELTLSSLSAAGLYDTPTAVGAAAAATASEWTLPSGPQDPSLPMAINIQAAAMGVDVDAGPSLHQEGSPQSLAPYSFGHARSWQQPSAPLLALQPPLSPLRTPSAGAPQPASAGTSPTWLRAASAVHPGPHGRSIWEILHLGGGSQGNGASGPRQSVDCSSTGQDTPTWHFTPQGVTLLSEDNLAHKNLMATTEAAVDDEINRAAEDTPLPALSVALSDPATTSSPLSTPASLPQHSQLGSSKALDVEGGQLLSKEVPGRSGTSMAGGYQALERNVVRLAAITRDTVTSGQDSLGSTGGCCPSDSSLPLVITSTCPSPKSPTSQHRGLKAESSREGSGSRRQSQPVLQHCDQRVTEKVILDSSMCSS